jgi:hypothetical protein
MTTFAVSKLRVKSFHLIRSWFQRDNIVGRLSKEDLAFYDGIAERIRDLLQDSGRNMSIAALAGYIGWNRSSLSNFLSRKTQTISMHLLVKAAKALHVPAGYLMTDD